MNENSTMGGHTYLELFSIDNLHQTPKLSRILFFSFETTPVTYPAEPSEGGRGVSGSLDGGGGCDMIPKTRMGGEML